MKHPLYLLVIPASLTLAVALAGTSGLQGRSCCGAMMASQHDAHHAGNAVQAKQLKDKQTASILIDNGYNPATIAVKRGKPVELTFTGGKNLGCGGTVVFKSLNLSQEVAVGKSTVVKFTPKAKGEILFTCGMGMLKGKVLVE